MTTVNKEDNKTDTDIKPKRRTRTKAKSEPGIAESSNAVETGETPETPETTETSETTAQLGAEPGMGTDAEKMAGQLAVEFTIEIKKDEIEKKFNETLDKYAADIKLPGFRVGKAPIEVVRNRFKDAIQEEVINQVLNDAVFKKIEKEKLRVLTKPVVKKIDYQEGQDLKADMMMEVLPEINLPDLETLEVEIPLKDLEHEPFDEQKAIDRLLSSQMRQVPVTDRGVKENDMVALKYQSKILATKRIDRTRTDYYMVINNNNTFEILDLYNDILDKKIHEHLTLKRTYPADYRKKTWAGKEVEHYIEISGIYEMVKPELDEKFFNAHGVKDEAELKQHLQNEHEEHVKIHREEKKTGLVIEKLTDMMNFPLPQALVEEEMSRIVKENPYQFAFNYQDENERNKAVVALKTRAEKSVRFSFIVEAIKDKYHVKVTSEDLENQCRTIAARNHMEFKEIRNFYMKPENKSYLEESLVRVKVLDLLKEKIKIKEV